MTFGASPRAVVLGAMCAAALFAGCASVDLPEGANVSVAGNEAVGESALLEMAQRELRSFVERGRKASDLADAAYSMERGLQDLGYAHATVDFDAQPSDEQPDRVVFRVAEGPRAERGAVRFPGATVFSRERLLEFFKVPPTDFLGLSEPPFRLSDVEGAVADVSRLYLLDGYADATIGPARLTWSADLRVADVEVPIVEGRRYVVTDVVVEGADPALRAELVRSLDLIGRPWHARVAAEAAAAARRFLLGQGRRAAQAEGKAEVDRGEKPGARLLVTVRPGPVFRAGDVRVTGNVRTDTDFLRGLVTIRPGDVLGEKAIDESIDRLYGTGVLRSVDAETPGTASAPKTPVAVSDLDFAVEELEARSVEVGGGWGSYERARGQIEYRDRNLFGRAREFSVKTTASLVSEGMETSLTDRYLVGTHNTVRLAAAWYHRQEPSFERQELSGEASIRHDFREGLWFKGGYRIRVEQAQQKEGRIPGAEEKGFIRSAGPFIEGARDTRDEQIFPKNGSLLEAGIFRSAPAFGADLDFVEAKVSAYRFLPLADGTVLALGMRFTTRDPQDERFTLPIQERLFLGGADSVRSFGESELGPSNAANEPVGGLTSAEAHAELRQNIRGNLDGALFYDVGTIGNDAWDLSDPYGQAIGVGLRYRLPVGPIRLDFAWNPGRLFVANRPWAIHFSFGFSF